MSKEQRAKLHKRSRSCSPSRGRMDVRQVQTHPALLKALGQTNHPRHALSACYGGHCPESSSAWVTQEVLTKDLQHRQRGDRQVAKAEQKRDKPHLAGNVGKFYAATCPKCCVILKNVSYCLQDHRHPESRHDNHTANLKKFVGRSMFMPKGTSKQFREIWKLDSKK